MKKYSCLILLALIFLSSCSLDDEPTAEFSFEFMSIEGVIMPDEFVRGQTYAIGVSYTKPNSCYQFNDFAYDIDGDEFTVAVVNIVYQGEDTVCTGNPSIDTVSFDFTVTGTDNYVFKFFQGENENGVDEYHIVEVPIVDGRGISVDTKN